MQGAGIPLSPTPAGFALWHPSSPWKTVRSMLWLVLLLSLITQLIAVLFASIFDSNFNGIIGPTDSLKALGSAICLTPLLLILVYIRRPKLLQLVKASPAIEGFTQHVVDQNTVVVSPMPTTIKHHIVKDSTPLEMPKSSHLWALFFGGVIIAAISLIISTIFMDNILIFLLLVLIIVIPAWIIGFSTPVFAWWSASTRFFGFRLTRREGEAMLIAGMLSALPAIVINSTLFPISINMLGVNDPMSSNLGEFLLLAVSAPFGEELSKALAVLLLYSYIDSAKKGFYVGTTVGLGFALIENLMYIMSSLIGGDGFVFAFTSIIRGIGSVPGHAMWTGISGYGIGYYLHRRRGFPAENRDTSWVLYDENTRQVVSYSNQNKAVTADLPNWWMRHVGSGWSLPKSPLFCIALAISGHSFWNGSLFIISYVFENSHPITYVLAMLGWLVILIFMLWYCSLRILPSLFTTTYREKSLNYGDGHTL
ncbi:PrsW family intramembrane metalloprotease [Candidatus Poseidoniaceae archaeon]|nr:PrsW family intramembrane metalloprotease [Candidatus Poseidoniaceae archaeon]|tara:strand:+ start:719 stop:2158 length:1440 start_codon:yes stop_codon:yes gene_type:complete